MVHRELVNITCTNCGFSFQKGDVDKECSNCFACTGCETYICPQCDREIIVKPVGQAKRRHSGSTAPKQ